MFEKITDFGDNCVAAAPDTLKGTAQENKELFDRGVKNVVATAINRLVDELGAEDAAGCIGAKGGSIQSILDGLPDEIRESVADAMAQVVADAPEDLDTLKELSDWIKSHAESAAQMNSAIAGKVDKEDGKVLSDNNYSDEDKEKVATATDKAYVDGLVGDIETALDNIISIQNTLIGGDA